MKGDAIDSARPRACGANFDLCATGLHALSPDPLLASLENFPPVNTAVKVLASISKAWIGRQKLMESYRA